MIFSLTIKGKEFLDNSDTFYSEQVSEGSKSWRDRSILSFLEAQDQSFKDLRVGLGFNAKTLVSHLDDLEARGYIEYIRD